MKHVDDDDAKIPQSPWQQTTMARFPAPWTCGHGPFVSSNLGYLLSRSDKSSQDKTACRQIKTVVMRRYDLIGDSRVDVFTACFDTSYLVTVACTVTPVDEVAALLGDPSSWSEAVLQIPGNRKSEHAPP